MPSGRTAGSRSICSMAIMRADSRQSASKARTHLDQMKETEGLATQLDAREHALPEPPPVGLGRTPTPAPDPFAFPPRPSGVSTVDEFSRTVMRVLHAV